MTGQKLLDDGDANAEAGFGQSLGDGRPRQVGPEDTVPVGVTRRMRVNDLQEGPIQVREEGQTRRPAAPFFRCSRSGGKDSSRRSSARPRSMVRRWQPRTVAT